MHQRKKCIVVIIVALSVVCTQAFAEDYYTWIDDQGNMHMSDSLGKVPEQYRDQIERKRFNSEEQGVSAGSVNAGPERGERPLTGPLGARGNKTAVQEKLRKYEINFTPNEGSAKRVIVQARINGRVTAPVAIDTGAPNTVISASLAEQLGLFDNDHGKLLIQAGGIGGNTPAIRTILDRLEVGEAKSEFVPTTIVEELSPAFEGLLGLDFVSHYRVTIDSARSVVIFEELPVNPDHIAGHDKDWWSSLFREFGSYQASWKEYSDIIKRRIDASLSSTNNRDVRRKELADEQCREADKLFDRLNSYASLHSVPIHWRR